MTREEGQFSGEGAVTCESGNVYVADALQHQTRRVNQWKAVIILICMLREK